MKRPFIVALFSLLVPIGLACTQPEATLSPPRAKPSPAATPTSAQTPTSEPTVTPAPTPTATLAPVATRVPTSAVAPTATPVPTATPTLTPTPIATPAATGPLTPAQLFARISPSVAFIETPTAKGSGVLIKGGFVVTNAHVVWPYQNVRVVFPDGSEYKAARVLNWDLMGDLAVIGPLETAIDPVALVDREDLITGSEVFLIGYPGEAEQFPQPAISRGLVSRLREWDGIRMTYFQTDAAVAGGQSGGVLVTEEAEVIGISGLSFTEAGFGLVASAADVQPRVERLIAGEDVAGLGDRRLPLGGEEGEHRSVLENKGQSRLYVINEPAGTNVSIYLESRGDTLGFVLNAVRGSVVDLLNDPFSYLLDGAGGDMGIVAGDVTSVRTRFDGPYFLIVARRQVFRIPVGPLSEGSVDFQVTSNRRLAPYDDVDDGVQVAVGHTVAANMDYSLDQDNFVIDLEEGDTIDIVVESIMFDPVVAVSFAGAKVDQVVTDDNSGGGLVGLNPKLTYRAPHRGRFFIVVSDSNLSDVGGYFLTVAKAPPGAIPANPPSTPAPGTPTPTLVPVPIAKPTPLPLPIPKPTPAITVTPTVPQGTLWTRQFGSQGHDNAQSVAVDGAGNLYVVGETTGTLPGQTSVGASDAYIRKYDSNGKELWTRQFGTEGEDVATGVAVDPQGSVYVVGWTKGGLLPGQIHLGAADAFVRKYDSEGNNRWTRQFGTERGDIAEGVAVDGAGKVYVAVSTESVRPGWTGFLPDFFVRKYDSDGDEIWTLRFDAKRIDIARSVAVDRAGSTYVVGDAVGVLVEVNTILESAATFVRKFDSNGTQVWTRQFSVGKLTGGKGLAVNNSGDVYVTGPTFGALPGQTSVGASDAYIRKYDSNGKELWTRQFGTQSADNAPSVAVDGAGNLYVVGDTTGALPGQTSLGGEDAFVVKMSAGP